MEQMFNLSAAVVGGDLRQIEVARALTDLFKEVRIYGHPASEVPTAVVFGASLAELVHMNVIVLPITGVNEAGYALSYKSEPLINFERIIHSLNKGTWIITGSIPQKWLDRAIDLQLKVFEYAENDELAILNSIPTAEGALQIAMEQLPITIHNSTVVVVGFGRVGITVARVFKALGARTIIAARRPASLARAWEQGYEKIDIESLAEVITSADIIINTVPVLVLNEALIAQVSHQSIIIDLASSPYGTDIEAANKLNIKVITAPGLPGKVAPKTAGLILAAMIPKLIRECLGGGVR